MHIASLNYSELMHTVNIAIKPDCECPVAQASLQHDESVIHGGCCTIVIHYERQGLAMDLVSNPSPSDAPVTERHGGGRKVDPEGPRKTATA
jgi:hypothetical protein